jgi:Serpin (serine protease inhibitor)
MSTQTCDLAECVAGYSGRLHAAIRTGHQVASPLGAWLLLALAGPAASGADRAELTEVLGCDVEAAALAAEDLLDHPHPVVASAAAVWTRHGRDLSEHFRRWRLGLPPAVEFAALAGQPALDAWAREHTMGLIERFPVRVAPETYLVLATALATKVSWEVPFDLAPAAALGETSEWSRSLQRVLRVPDPERARGHRQFIAASAEAGDVAVHVAAARDGLLVYSVAAAREVPAASVLAVAHQIGRADAIGAPAGARALDELALGAGPAWVLREDRGVRDICTAVLPAWSAESSHDLTRPGLGFDAVKDALAPGQDPWQAGQAAMARYSRTGFEAAAVTTVAVAAAMIQRTGTRRVAELRFGHPYAVVAVAIDADHGPWHGVPVFSAWVAEPDDAQN